MLFLCALASPACVCLRILTDALVSPRTLFGVTPHRRAATHELKHRQCLGWWRTLVARVERLCNEARGSVSLSICHPLPDSSSCSRFTTAAQQTLSIASEDSRPPARGEEAVKCSPHPRHDFRIRKDSINGPLHMHAC